MKKEIHPPYQKILFIDSASGHKFVCGSALKPEGKEVFEGVEYPVCYLSISSTSHPFFTGSKGLVDSEGRVEKFKRRFERKKEAQPEDSASEEQAAIQEQPKQEKKAADKGAKAPKTAKKK